MHIRNPSSARKLMTLVLAGISLWADAAHALSLADTVNLSGVFDPSGLTNPPNATVMVKLLAVSPSILAGLPSNSPTFGCMNERIDLMGQQLWCGMYNVNAPNGAFSLTLGSSEGRMITPQCSGGALSLSSLLSMQFSTTTQLVLSSMVQIGSCWFVMAETQVNSTPFSLRAQNLGGHDASAFIHYDKDGSIVSSDGTAIIDAAGNWLGQLDFSSGIAVSSGGLGVSGPGAVSLSPAKGVHFTSGITVSGTQGMTVTSSSALIVDAGAQLRVHGNATFSGAGSGLTMDTNTSLTVQSAASFTNSVTMAGTNNRFLGGGSLAGIFAGIPTFSGNPQFSGTPNFTAGSAWTGSFTGNPTFSGGPTFSGTPAFGQGMDFGSNTVSSTTSGFPAFSNLVSFSNGATLRSVAGTQTFSGSVTTTGTSTLNAGATISGTISGNLAFTGTVTFDSNSSVSFSGSINANCANCAANNQIDGYVTTTTASAKGTLANADTYIKGRYVSDQTVNGWPDSSVGNDTYNRLICPYGYYARGVQGYSGSRLDGLGLHCARLRNP